MKFELFIGDNFEFNFSQKIGELITCTGLLPLGIHLYDNALKGSVHANAEARFYNAKLTGSRGELDIEFNILEKRNSYTHNNHMQYGYGPHMKAWTYDRPTTFKWIFGKPERTQIGNMLEEGIKAAKLIEQKANGKPIALLMSGGIDSDGLAYCFHQAGVAFTPINLRYKVKNHYINDFDFQFVEPLCKKMGYAAPKFIDLDVVDTYLHDKNWMPYVEDYGIHRPEFVLLLKGLEQVIQQGYFPALSGTPTLYFPHYHTGPDANGKFFMPPFLLHDSFFSYHRMFDKYKVEGVGHFMYYTPELFYSQLQNEYVRGLVEKNLPTFYDERVAHYNTGGIVVDRKPDKYNGFEEMYRAFYYATGKMFYGEPTSPCYRTDLHFLKTYSLQGIKQLLEFKLDNLPTGGNLDVAYLKSQQILEPAPTLDIIYLQVLANKMKPVVKEGFFAELVLDSMSDPKIEAYKEKSKLITV